MQTLVPYRRRHGFLGRPMHHFAAFERTPFMPTDIEKTDDKDNVELELKDGYLKITAETASENEETKEAENGAHYIRRERFAGSCRRAFYVGEDINEDAIKAKFDDGVLKVSVPFVEHEEEPEEKKLIEIEG